jgi:aspartate-semialdehyde dehydrogenase
MGDAEIEIEGGIQVAVYGATGALGREVLLSLEGHGLPVESLVAVGGVQSAGREAYWRSHPITVVGEQHVDVGDLDVAILAVPASAAESLRAQLIDAGVFVIDLSAGGGERPLPLVWPSFDMSALETHPGGVSLPCGIAGALAPIVRSLSGVATVADLDVTAMMSAQAAGRRGEQALSAQTVALLNQRLPTADVFGGVLAFNLLPGSPHAKGAEDPVVTRALDELQRIEPSAAEIVTSIRVIQVPVFAGLGLTLRVTFAGTPPTRAQLDACLEAAEELRPIPDEGRLALRDTMERDAVFLADLAVRDDGVLHAFVATDPLHRSAWAVGAVLERVLAEDLW